MVSQTEGLVISNALSRKARKPQVEGLEKRSETVFGNSYSICCEIAFVRIAHFYALRFALFFAVLSGSLFINANARQISHWVILSREIT